MMSTNFLNSFFTIIYFYIFHCYTRGEYYFKNIMKKTIEFKLSLSDPFFVELKEKVLLMNGVGGFEEYMPTIISQVMHGTLATFKELASPVLDTSDTFQFSYEHEENIYPQYHNLLDHNIDTALNRRIHTTTLERITDIIEDYTCEYADKQNLNLIEEHVQTKSRRNKR